MNKTSLRSNNSLLANVVLVAVMFWLVIPPEPAAAGNVYYVNFDGGNDASDGLSQSTAWKTIPGTRNLSNSDWLRTSWGAGAVSNANKIPAGTTFMLKPGTTYSNSNGGILWISKTYYEDNAATANPISIEIDPTWGSGSVLFDATDIQVPIALILIQINGIKIDGLQPGGIIIQRSELEGIQVKEKSDGSAVRDCVFKNLKLFDNGRSISTDQGGAGSGQINLRKVDGCIIDQVEFNGNNNYINGLLGGDSHKTVFNVFVSNSVSYNHKGDVSGNDTGIGFKVLNGRVTFHQVSSYNNLKGMDLGEHSGDGHVFVYKIFNSESYDNYWGINFNNTGDAQSGGVSQLYVVNSIIRSNRFKGMHLYAGPWDAYIIHNTFDNNGVDSSGYGACQLSSTADNPEDGHQWTYSFNNIFTDSNPGSQPDWIIDVSRWYPDNSDDGFSLIFDYNSYKQTGSELFAYFGSFAGSWAHTTFQFGPNGPGNSDGSWYEWYNGDTTPPAGEYLGHHGCDPNSKGTGASDPMLPSFTDLAQGDYTLTGSYPGKMLSSEPWYIPEMGIDRNGFNRTHWDMGAYEYISTTSIQGDPDGDGTPPQILNYQLSQNYPNPFNPSTTIKYIIPVSSKQYTAGSQQSQSFNQPINKSYDELALIQLKVYDMLGCEIATLVNEQQRPGIYEVAWDASNVSSGVYFYQLRAGNFIQVKKLILMK